MKVILAIFLASIACKTKDEPAPEPPSPVILTGATPEDAFRNYQKAVTANDLDFLWSFVSDKDMAGWLGKQLAPMNGGNVPTSRMAEFAEGYRSTPDQIRAMSKHDFDRHFIGMFVGKGALLIPQQKIAKAKVTGDTAILDLDAPASKFVLVKEGGQWHWDIKGTSAANR